MALGASERTVSISPGLSGTLAAAKRSAPHPCVVMLHGFGGHRDEVGNLFAKLARRLAKHGLSSLRFDFPGCGRSDGEFGDITVPLYRRAAIAALRFAKSVPGADPNCLGLLGYSFGGAIATTCLGADAPRARALVLWAPVGMPSIDMVESLGAERAAEAERAGAVAVPWGKGEIRLKRAFFRSLAEVSPLEAIAHYDGSLYVLAGSRDRLAKHVGDFYAAAKRARRREQRVIEEADHFFGATARGGKVHVEALLAETAGFFAATLRAA